MKKFLIWYVDSAEEVCESISARTKSEAIDIFNINHFVDIIAIDEVEKDTP